jgi:Trk K+ transport system NAD-binding subunit
MLGRGFEATGQNFLIIERDIDRVQQLKALGFQVIFADARYIEKIALNVLESTSIVLITTSERGLSRLIVERIASVRGALPMIVRCQDDEAAEIREIIARVSLIQPQVEAALEMLREALICLGMPSLEAAARIGEWRPQAYGARGVDSLQKNEMQHFQMTRDLDLHWYEVSEQSPLLGAMLKESQLREQYGLMVAAIVRGATVQLSIKPDTVFEQGDVVALLGASRQIADFLEQVRRLTS